MELIRYDILQETSLTGAGGITALAADIPGNRDMYLMQNLKVLNAIGNAANKWTTELYDVLEVKHQIGGTVPHKTAQFTTNISRKAYADSLEQFHSAFSVQSWQSKPPAKPEA